MGLFADGVAQISQHGGQRCAVCLREWRDGQLRITDSGTDHIQSRFHGAEPMSSFAAGMVGLKLQAHQWSEEFPEGAGFGQIR